MSVVKEVSLVESHPSVPARIEPASLMHMIERFTIDPSVDVGKLEKLLDLHERAAARFAQEQFNAAMSAAQREMRPVTVDAYNPQTKSRYASYEALDGSIRPIYSQHGFGLSFNTGECPLPDGVRVLCDVSHLGGHVKTYHIDMPADGKGAKGGDVMTRTHATGAAVSYGMRYLLKMIFNIAVGEGDDDGNSAAPPKPRPQAQSPEPSGFDQWRSDISAAADNGWTAFGKAWNASPENLRKHLNTVDRNALNNLKAKARSADEATKQAGQ